MEVTDLSYKLLESAKMSTEKLLKYFNEINIEKVDDEGLPMFTVLPALEMVNSLSNIVKAMTNLEKQMRFELGREQSRGKREIGLYERR
jgi:hypothetical protein